VAALAGPGLALAALLLLGSGAGLAQSGPSSGFNRDGVENAPDGSAVPERGIDDGDVAVPDDIIINSDNLVRAPKAWLRGLDTLTNTVNDFEIRVGQPLRFKRLIVALDACLYPSDDPGSDAYAFLRIRDQREEANRFSGWMLASSPALSALDHPRYDVWVLSCMTE